MDFTIGRCSAVLLGTTFDQRHGLKMGANSVINENCRIDTRGTVYIGDNVSISARVDILTADHDVQHSLFAGRARAVRIKDYAFIGTRALLLPGVTIGRGAVVAAGSVVTRDVPDHTIVAGNPARPIGLRSHDLRYLLDYRRLLH